MGEVTGISWTDRTWNPWHGCLKISAGCKFCYMYRDKKRYGQDPAIVVRSKTTFNDPLKWKSGRVFTCSWSDFFIEQADGWRDEAWDVIRRTPHLTYQILTKRPERIAGHLPADWGTGWPNVWLGVSVEDEDYADQRIPLLVQTPAAIRFLSMEPLLGPVSLRWMPVFGKPYACQRKDSNSTKHLDGLKQIDWVICGGESGPEARMFRSEWAKVLLEECREARVPFFLKQMGSCAVLDSRYDQTLSGASRKLRDPKGADPEEWPEFFRVQQFPVSRGLGK